MYRSPGSNPGFSAKNLNRFARVWFRFFFCKNLDFPYVFPTFSLFSPCSNTTLSGTVKRYYTPIHKNQKISPVIKLRANRLFKFSRFSLRLTNISFRVIIIYTKNKPAMRKNAKKSRGLLCSTAKNVNC